MRQEMPTVSTLCSKTIEYFAAIFIFPHFFQDPYNSYIYFLLSEKYFKINIILNDLKSCQKENDKNHNVSRFFTLSDRYLNMLHLRC